MSHVNVIGVQFRRAGKIYDFLPSQYSLRVGDDVVVDTERGPSLAKVVRVQFVDDGAFSEAPLKNVMRKATDLDLRETSHLSMDEAADIARRRVEAFKLNMRIMKAEGQFGGNKIIVYFSAPGRVDFRDLVKDLASALRARVELKQVGARDEAKLVGGLGICGREYCCSSFLRDFVPVSIKMAKNQNLALNPSKVSGGCGRLLCCLTYENDAYKDLRSKLPPLGAKVRSLDDGTVGIVIKTDILNQGVMFETGDGRKISAKVKELEVLEKSNVKPDESEMSEAESWGEDLDVGQLLGSQKSNEQDRRPRQDGQRQDSGRRDGPSRDGAPRGPAPRGPAPRGPAPRGISLRDGGPKGPGSQDSQGQRPHRGPNNKPPKR
jgi:cell fate regulator YaaT (PSP1 superfamily)